MTCSQNIYKIVSTIFTLVWHCWSVENSPYETHCSRQCSHASSAVSEMAGNNFVFIWLPRLRLVKYPDVQ